MIGQLSGNISHKRDSWIILNAGGVGYKVFIEKETLNLIKEGEELSIWTHLAVREKSLDLYGFETMEKLSLFELLISVSGIGPKSALSILDAASPTILRRAVATRETESLTGISGIGKKCAEKIILELRGKLHFNADEDMRSNVIDVEIYEALIGMGYSAKEARNAVSKLPNKDEEPQKRLREALKNLS